MPNRTSKLRFILYRLKRKIIKSSISLYSWRDKLPYFLGLKKAKKGSMPDFIIAGLPKCGTVWLVEALKSDPYFEYVGNLFFTHKGEIRFFSFYFNQPISKYLDDFGKRRGDQEKLLFEKSPDYSTMNIWRLRLIKRLNPSIKIILIFRDPIQRAFSNAKMDLIRKRKIELKPENDHYFLRSYKGQIKRYNYASILKKWFSVFDKSQILILSMEDIRDKPTKVLETTFLFLGKKYEGNQSNLDEPKNVTTASSIPSSHQEFLEKNLSSTIDYWEKNQHLFRLTDF